MTNPGEEVRAVEDEPTRMLRVLRRCTCIADYKDRDMRDPECQFCSGFHEEAADCIESLRARAERAEARIEHEVRLRRQWEQIAKDETARTESAERERDALVKALRDIASHDFGTCAYVGLENIVHAARAAIAAAEKPA